MQTISINRREKISNVKATIINQITAFTADDILQILRKSDDENDYTRQDVIRAIESLRNSSAVVRYGGKYYCPHKLMKSYKYLRSSRV